MASYRYKGISAAGRATTGRMDAANEADLELRLRGMGLELVSCRLRLAPAWRRAARVGRRDLALFCFHLEQTARAGVPLLEGLRDLRTAADNPRLREIVTAMSEAIEGGKTLSQSLGAFPGVFSDVFVNLVRAGEQAGELDRVLERLGKNLKWQDEQASSFRKLMIYPLVAGVAVIGTVFFLMIYLAPELLTFVKNTGSTLPVHTRLLIRVSGWVTQYWHAMLAAPPLLVGMVAGAARLSPGLRRALDRLKLKTPVLGPVLEKLILARVSACFAMMYSSGITVIDCLEACERIAGNRAVEQALQNVGRAVAAGSTLADGFADGGLFPPLAQRMLRVGETTGALAPALENVAYFYTRDAREAVARLQSLMEPLLTLVLGGLIGWVVFSVLGPVYDLVAGIDI